MKRIIKFLITGGIGVSVNLLTLHFLVVAGVPYLLGSALALIASTIVGFTLQRFWTFENRTREGVQKQFLLYVGLVLINLAINTALVYVLVEYLHAHYLVAQFVGAGIVAVSSYFAYHLYIFRASL